MTLGSLWLHAVRIHTKEPTIQEAEKRRQVILHPVSFSMILLVAEYHC